MAIMDMGAHSAPDELKDKWIETCRAHTSTRHASAGKFSPESKNDRPALQEKLKNIDRGGVIPDSGVPEGQEIGRRHHPSPSLTNKLHKVLDRLHITSTGDESKTPSRSKCHPSDRKPGDLVV